MKIPINISEGELVDLLSAQLKTADAGDDTCRWQARLMLHVGDLLEICREVADEVEPTAADERIERRRAEGAYLRLDRQHPLGSEHAAEQAAMDSLRHSSPLIASL